MIVNHFKTDAVQVESNSNYLERFLNSGPANHPDPWHGRWRKMPRGPWHYVLDKHLVRIDYKTRAEAMEAAKIAFMERDNS